MAMKAFVEISVAAGKAKDVVAELRRMRSAVVHVCSVTGHCDIMAIVELPDLRSFSELLMEKIQRLKGVARTESLICITNDSSR